MENGDNKVFEKEEWHQFIVEWNWLSSCALITWYELFTYKSSFHLIESYRQLTVFLSLLHKLFGQEGCNNCINNLMYSFIAIIYLYVDHMIWTVDFLTLIRQNELLCTYFGPRVYTKGSLVISLVRPCDRPIFDFRGSQMIFLSISLHPVIKIFWNLFICNKLNFI